MEINRKAKIHPSIRYGHFYTHQMSLQKRKTHALDLPIHAILDAIFDVNDYFISNNVYSESFQDPFNVSLLK